MLTASQPSVGHYCCCVKSYLACMHACMQGRDAHAGTIKQLGEFYKKKGQRARLPRALGDDLLAKLATAENALPVSLNVRGEQRA